MNPISKTLIVSLSWVIVFGIVLYVLTLDEASIFIVVVLYPLYTTPVMALMAFIAFSIFQGRWVRDNIWAFSLFLGFIVLLIMPSFPKGFHILFDLFFKFKLL